MQTRMTLRDFLVAKRMDAESAADIEEAYVDNGMLGVVLVVRAWNTEQHDYDDEVRELVRAWERLRVQEELELVSE